jgi:hypothetical protein
MSKSPIKNKKTKIDKELLTCILCRNKIHLYDSKHKCDVRNIKINNNIVL